MTLNELNNIESTVALNWFQETCAAQRWCELMVANRPYASLAELKDAALISWQQMQETDYLQAFDAHPMIGDVNSLKKKFTSTKTMAAGEQSKTAEASEATLQELNRLNHAYLQQNGFIFIICATGLSADVMLNALQERIHHNREQELTIAAGEQIKITLLRLEKNL